MAEFKRPDEGFRFHFEGVQTRDVPDALPPHKYAAAQNVRSTGNNSIRTRPGYVPLFSTGSNAITDVRGYATLQTDSLPRFLARDAGGTIWNDGGSSLATLAGNAGYGASLITFRPAESPQSWMYIGTEGDYQKFSAPALNNNIVTQYKCGIAEPQKAVDAFPITPFWQNFTSIASGYTPGGNAGNTSAFNRSVDTVGAAIQDPASFTRYSLQVGNNANAQYGNGELILIGGGTLAIVQQVIPAIAPGNATTVQTSYSANGVCTVVPSIVPFGANNSLGTLVRGSLLNIGGSVYFVLGTVPGPNGSVAVQVAANSNLSGNISGVPAVIVDTSGAVSGGVSISSGAISANISLANNSNGTSQGWFTQIVSPSPFDNADFVAQPDDYIHFSLSLSDPSQLIQMLMLFNLDGGNNNNNFNGNVMYYSVQPGDLVGVTSGNVTQLGAILQAAENLIIGELPTANNISSPAQSGNGNNQWAEVLFPISALTRLGGDQSKSLADCTAVQLQFTVANNVTVNWGSMWTGGGGQPDIGNNGIPYSYQCVPLSSLTGVRGNPTPLMRYGVPALRQSIDVRTSALNASYDPQIDTWEVYRYGGSITSYRFVGTVPVGNDFVDDNFDDAAEAGNAVTIDNTEPWPSIDVPWRQSGGSITAYGPFLQVSGTLPATMNRWLPGTIFQVGGQQAFTLRSRPIVSGNNVTFEFEENVGSGSQSSVFVLEPNVANQPLPYLWGPNEQGYVFGCGDPLRLGVVSWSKAFAPDAVPTAYDLELCPPSEPLMGGEVISGISLVASSLRWWALYFQSGGTPLFAQVEVPVGKRLASPWGKCTDGATLYFWATDCIAKTSAQGGGESLTDTDLFNLFPHGGISGKNVTRGAVTFYAPDYSRAATFRLAIREGILYAVYQDSTGAYRMLVGQRTAGGTFAWSSDAYPLSISTVYAIEQPRGTLELAPSLYPAIIYGSNSGQVVKLSDFTNDGNNSITPYVYPWEWDGGDLRAQYWWGDQYLDCSAASNITVTPVFLGNNVAPATTIAANNNRQFAVVDLAGGVLVNFLGLQITWTDNFNNSSNATTLHAWQPSFVAKPETIQKRFGDWYDFGQASYVRGCIIHADTFGANKNISIRNSDNNSLVQFAGGPANGQINHNNEQEIAYYFTPFVSHMVRDEPQDAVPWRKFAIEWIKDPWPELTDLSSPWLNLGAQGAKYLRGAVIPMDTNGNNVSLTFLSSDGGNRTVGPFSTTAAEKTAVGWAFTTPLIGHDFQLIPSGPIRVWYDEIRWDADPWPELIPEASSWINLGTPGAKYLRGAVIPMDTGGNNISINFISSGGANVSLPANTTANIKTPVPFAFSVPLIGHEFQLVPSVNNSVRIWWEEAKWMFDPWPELTAEASSWLDLGAQGAKYLRGAVIPVDTNNQAVSLTFVSSDGGNATVGPFTTPKGEKTAVPWAFTIPLIGHDFQLIPSGSVRVWYDEIRWDFQPWPELINEATGWLPVLQGGGAAFLQGLVLPIETAGVTPALSLLTDTGQTIALTPTVVPPHNVKTGVAYSLATPVICHQVQLLPTSPCRIWLGEIQWIAEPTPEMASTWTTQWTGLGGKGYKHIPRIEMSYNAPAGAVLTVNSFDGINANPLTLPAGNTTQKVLLTLTLNKGQLYRFSAYSASPFQIFEEDSIVWCADWGRPAEARAVRNFGAQFGDGARI
jgi:hypothetical protein